MREKKCHGLWTTFNDSMNINSTQFPSIIMDVFKQKKNKKRQKKTKCVSIDHHRIYNTCFACQPSTIWNAINDRLEIIKLLGPTGITAANKWWEKSWWKLITGYIKKCFGH